MKCAKCGKVATKLNPQNVPVCSRHTAVEIKAPACPNCGLGMALRESKFGKFWGCTAFPMCDGLKKL